MFEIKKVTMDKNCDSKQEVDVFRNCDPEDCDPAIPCTPNCTPECAPP